MKLSSIALATSITLMSSNAFAEAGDIWGNFHIGAKHSSEGYYKFEDNDGTKTPWNESNYGVGIEYETASYFSLVAGAYHNSVGSLSVYGAGNLHTPYTNIIGVGIKFGIVTGYADLYGVNMNLMAMPSLNFVFNEKFRIEVTYIPSVGENYDSVIAATAGWNFK